MIDLSKPQFSNNIKDAEEREILQLCSTCGCSCQLLYSAESSISVIKGMGDLSSSEKLNLGIRKHGAVHR